MMDGSQIYDYAEKQGWLLIHEGDYTHVYEKSLPVPEGAHEGYASRKYLYVMLNSNGQYDLDGSMLIIPHVAEHMELDNDQDAKVLLWWLDGNEGSEDDWWNQASEEDRKAHS